MKRIKYLFIFVLSIILFKTSDVYAFSMWANATTVYSGSQVAVTVDMSDLTGKFSITSSNQGVLAGGETNWYENQSTIIYFTALNPGQAIITAYSNNPSDVNGDNQGEVSRTITINVIEKPTYTEPIEINRTYSDNNYLSGLAIDGYDLKPEFNKDVLEYNLEVDYTVNKINVGATPEDDTANINGIGEYDLEEGKNTINIVVTAENGNEKTYVINVLVKELNPTEVKVDKNTYTLVKKSDKLPELNNYTKSTIKIDGVEVPALKGKVTKYILVGLKDSKGDIALYIYDAKNNSYKPYNEIKLNSISLYYMEKDNTNYKKTTIKVNGQNVTAYKKKGLEYYLIYGMNLDNGKVNWYTYDSKEGTIQIYLDGDKTSIIDNNNYLFLVYSLGGICVLLVIFNLTLYIKNKKMN